MVKPVDNDGNTSKQPSIPEPKVSCTAEDVINGTHSINEQNEPIYTCQGTEIPTFTTPLPWWDFRQYFEDYLSGNVGLGRLVQGFAYGVFSFLSNSGLKLGSPLRWLYDRLAFLWGPYPRRAGKIAEGQATPVCELNLQPGELVRVKSYEEILATLNHEKKTGVSILMQKWCLIAAILSV